MQDFTYEEIEQREAESLFELNYVGGQPEPYRGPVESPVARMGAKKVLRAWLVEQFPAHYCYVEPFMGSVKVLLWKSESNVEIINDFDGDMATFFQFVKTDPARLANYINAMPNHEAVVLGLRQMLAKRDLRGIERAVAFYLGSQSAFNGKGDYSSYKSSPSTLMNLQVNAKLLLRVSHRLRRVNIRSTGFERIILSCNKPVKGGVFFYLDPPYWATAGYKTFQNVSAFGWAEQCRLAELCFDIHQMGNRFIQTNSAHPDLASLYGDKRFEGVFHIKKVAVNYSLAGDSENRGDNFEYVISNFPLGEYGTKQHSLF